MENEFRVPASDTKGHSARQWFRCIPAMAREVEQVLQSKRFPYRTKGDILRHALHRHMAWLSTLEPMVTCTGQVEAILEIMRDEEMNEDFALVFGKMDELISRHLASGSDREATRLVLTVKQHIDKMPDGFWKDKYSDQLTSKYGKLIKKSSKAKLR